VVIFYCLRFETSLFVASYDSQGHGGGIQPRLHTGWVFFIVRREEEEKEKEVGEVVWPRFTTFTA
jgi:hypothetical protein